jgi:hypothetical protein
MAYRSHLSGSVSVESLVKNKAAKGALRQLITDDGKNLSTGDCMGRTLQIAAAV